MPLFDVYCLNCNSLWGEMVLASDETPGELQCETCGLVWEHAKCCNGGVGARYRFNDFPDKTDVDYYADHVSSTVDAVHVEHNDDGSVAETPATHWHTGSRMDSDPRFHGDGRAERRDRNKQAFKRKYGKTPVFIDMKGQR